MPPKCPPACTIVPPYLLRMLASAADRDVARRAAQTLTHDAALRADRGRPRSLLRATGCTHPVAPDRRLYDAAGTRRLPGKLLRTEAGPELSDQAALEAWAGFGATWELFAEEYGRDSLDGQGVTLNGTVHYGKGYDNAFWNGEQMVFGDGDGVVFGRFTASLDVIGHELAHGVTQYTANQEYAGQPGALNEHLSDVFGILVKQRRLGQTADQADWLIGAELLRPGVQGVALRNLLHPGTAYDDPRLGRDPQPDHMAQFVTTAEDHGGVHLNSGIPNRAFALAATVLGGPAWEGVGRVWYDVLTGPGLTTTTDFAGFAALTLTAAAARFGAGSGQHNAVRTAWEEVGVPVAGGRRPKASKSPAPAPDPRADLVVRRTGGLAGLSRERSLMLGDLPAADAQAWATLLAGEHGVSRPPEAEATRDGFCYAVASSHHHVRFTVAEGQLSDAVRELFDRTLGAERPVTPGSGGSP